MGRIHRLPPAVRNQIAAGEVVERPAAVVRELIENALDAGASTITVRVEGAGKTAIRVRDDGTGMSPAEARLALERHATSKIESVEDLTAVASLGFRGEALPSIASVSRFRLRTREREADSGWEIAADGGAALEERPAAMPPGTLVEVRDLFFNLPARRKFLRADRTESSHCTAAVFRLALAWPAVGFRFDRGGRRVLRVEPAEDTAARLAQLEQRWSRDAIAVEAQVGELAVRAFLSPPMASRGASARLQLFVNGRPVKDRRLFHAVAEAYRRLSSLSGTPKGYVFLEAPPETVDVNVHPAKAEVRFSRPGAAWEAVFRTVRAALEGSPRRVTLALGGFRERRGSRFGRPSSPGGSPNRPQPHPDPSPRSGTDKRTDRADAAAEAGAGFRSSGSGALQRLPGDTGGLPPTAPRYFDFGGSPPTVLAQFQRTYILAEEPGELLLLDQHAAEERVLYNRLMERTERVRSLPLLQPVPLELAALERTALAAAADELRAAGFELEEFGEGAWLLRSVPEVLGVGRGLDVLLRTLGAETGECAAGVFHDARARLMASLACHAAVTAGVPLGPARMRAILAALWAARNPSTCPHGRPTVVRLDLPAIERRFGRR